jgi:hypothetical protein
MILSSERAAQHDKQVQNRTRCGTEENHSFSRHYFRKHANSDIGTFDNISKN